MMDSEDLREVASATSFVEILAATSRRSLLAPELAHV